MWQEYFIMGGWCWANDKGQQLTIFRRNQWDIDLNNNTKTSRATFEEAKSVVDRFMQENP